jgi:hypothetical protein
MKVWQIIILAIVSFFIAENAIASSLVDRLEKFPQWNDKPLVRVAEEDLIYPDWFAGQWQVTSTAIEQVAPLAPKIVTPGFENNRKYLNKPVRFQVRFQKNYSPKPTKLLTSSAIAGKLPVVADRAFNGLKIARAYFGDEGVISVKIDPKNFNKQITVLKSGDRLISTVTGRNSEQPARNHFFSTEITQQLFRNRSGIYLNEVETTTVYQLLDSGNIEANQVTAIYLSPQDPDYFSAGDRPVALYKYHLLLDPTKY